MPAGNCAGGAPRGAFVPRFGSDTSGPTVTARPPRIPHQSAQSSSSSAMTSQASNSVGEITRLRSVSYLDQTVAKPESLGISDWISTPLASLSQSLNSTRVVVVSCVVLPSALTTLEVCFSTVRAAGIACEYALN